MICPHLAQNAQLTRLGFSWHNAGSPLVTTVGPALSPRLVFAITPDERKQAPPPPDAARNLFIDQRHVAIESRPSPRAGCC